MVGALCLGLIDFVFCCGVRELWLVWSAFVAADSNSVTQISFGKTYRTADAPGYAGNDRRKIVLEQQQVRGSTPSWRIG